MCSETEQEDILQMFSRTLIYSSFNANACVLLHVCVTADYIINHVLDSNLQTLTPTSPFRGVIPATWTRSWGTDKLIPGYKKWQQVCSHIQTFQVTSRNV